MAAHSRVFCSRLLFKLPGLMLEASSEAHFVPTRPQLAQLVMWKNYPYEIVITWLTQCLYGAVLASTLPADLSISIWTFVHAAIAGLLAQLAGTASIRNTSQLIDSCGCGRLALHRPRKKCQTLSGTKYSNSLVQTTTMATTCSVLCS